MLGSFPHRTLYNLAKKYGPIMSLRLGNVPTIVVSTPAAAELFLKTHDTVFASRPKSQAAWYLVYGAKDMALAEYGPYWRNVRKFCALELLSVTKIDSFTGMRREEIGLLVEGLRGATAAREVVDVSGKVAGLIEDMTCRMLFGRSRDERFDIHGVIQELMELLGAFNIADYVPFLGALDLQGLTRRLKTTRKAIDKILESIIDEHEQDASCGHKRLDRDFVDVMLSLKKNYSSTHDQLSNTIDRTNIKAIILDMIVGAIDTSHTAIEWTLSELIKHPRAMKRLQEELNAIVGENEMVEEAHLPKLEYLDMVVKESFRLHPVAPLLIPHESMEDTVINGYYIPKKSRIIINNWGLGRDINVWSDNVLEFLPERFTGRNIDLRGQHFQLIPFGSGRRGCPGMYLGLINIKLVVAQLVHCFSWELPIGTSPDELDMDEKFGLSLPRAKPLLAIPTLRI